MGSKCDMYALSVGVPCFVRMHALGEGAHAHVFDAADDPAVLEYERRGLCDEVLNVFLLFS